MGEFIAAPQTVEELDDRLSIPSPRLIETFAALDGDIMLVGVGGKMGPTMARMARRAADTAGRPRRVIGVSRFSSTGLREQLEGWGVETIAADLLAEGEVEKLPRVENVVYLAGFKFGSAAAPEMTWAMNCYLPALVCRHFRDSRIAAFSTGNVYGLVPVENAGSREADAPRPVGEYAMAALGRERMFEYFSRTLDIPVALLRLNYAAEMRYSVLVDLAQQVFAEKPIDVTMGYANVIWQGDANAMSLAALAETTSPAHPINIAGPERLSVREVCQQLGRLMNKPVALTGSEAPDALLSDGSHGYDLLGQPAVSAQRLIEWTAEWIQRGGPTHGKPTHFESRDGKF